MSATAYIMIQGKCGELIKLDISKFNKKIQKGLLREYGVMPAPTQYINWTPHSCKDCGQNCKAPNGFGTQKAADLKEITGRRQQILQAINAFGKATVRQIDLYLHTNFDVNTTDNATHSRISDLLYWKLVQQVDLDGPTEPGDIYPDTNAKAYMLNEARVKILEKHGWQTWILRAIDGGASFQLEGFSQAWSQ